MSARTYAMSRLGPGDYVWPSNDAAVLWRISTYDEDGSAYWTDDKGKDHPIVGTFWRLRRIRLSLDHMRGEFDPDEPRWEDAGDLRYPTRRAALEAAMRDDARRAEA